MNNRQRMRYSNKIAVKWLLSHDFDEIWLKRHTKRHDIHYTQNGNYVGLDLWKLFDGICINMVSTTPSLNRGYSEHGSMVFLQLKTNAWPSDNELIQWLKDKHGCYVMAINVRKVKKKWVAFNRFYYRTDEGVARITL